MEAVWPLEHCGMGQLQNNTCICDEGWSTEGLPVFKNAILCDQHNEAFTRVWTFIKGAMIVYLPLFLIIYIPSTRKRIERATPNVLSGVLVVLASEMKVTDISHRFLGNDVLLTTCWCVVLWLAQVTMRLDFIKYVRFAITNGGKLGTGNTTKSFFMKPGYVPVATFVSSISYVIITIASFLNSIYLLQVGFLLTGVFVVLAYIESRFILNSALLCVKSISRFASTIEEVHGQAHFNEVTQTGIQKMQKIEKRLKSRFRGYTISYSIYSTFILPIAMWPLLIRETKFVFPFILIVHLMLLYWNLISAFFRRRTNQADKRIYSSVIRESSKSRSMKNSRT